MLDRSLPFADNLKDLFYEGMDRQTSLYLFGSAATGHWVAGRSDLDLVVLVPKEKLELLGRKVRSWASMPGLPILDGYALSFSGRSSEAIRLDQFLRVTFPSNTNIDLIDQWNIKNRSKLLFGLDTINGFFPDISHDDLRAWAIEHLRYLSLSNPEGKVPETKVLADLIWSVSWSARMLMLSRGHLCESKREALNWLADEHVEIRGLVRLLLEDFSKSDKTIASINSEQSIALRSFCLKLLLQEVKNTTVGKNSTIK